MQVTDLGTARYPRYRVWRTRPVWRTRAALLAYEAALEHAAVLDAALEANALLVAHAQHAQRCMMPLSLAHLLCMAIQ